MLNVSVVIPAYNCQRYLASAIRSALSQSVHEIIVINDGSSDRTEAVARQFDHPRLRYLSQDNQGVSAARNAGIAVATGHLIAFLDADDYFLPNKIAQQVALFEATPALGLVQSGWQQVDHADNVIREIAPWQKAPDLTLETWLRFKPVLPSALMVRRQWLIDIGGFDAQLQAAEDIDLVSRLALKGCRGEWLRTVAVGYRKHHESAMGDGLAQARDLSKFLDKFFLQPDLPVGVQIMERSVRYHTLLWAAWYLQHTGHADEMVDYLKRTWAYSPHSPTGALIHWADSFSEFSAATHRPTDINALVHSDQWQQVVEWLLQQQ